GKKLIDKVNNHLLSSNNKRLNIAFLGRLSLENEVAKFTQSIELLRKKGFTVSMKWVGDGPLRSLAETVGEVTGFVNEPTQYLQTADIIFVSSYLSLLEAQSLGKICCSFYSHALKKRYLETYPGSQWCVVAEEPQQLLEQLLKLTDSEALTLRTAGKDWATLQTWEKVTDTYEAIWNS
ncbi:MAG: glycosyltransferase family 4 protein, partial [bacterium]|nr:glycosyltransferase family 4 protein [bacterium]